MEIHSQTRPGPARYHCGKVRREVIFLSFAKANHCQPTIGMEDGREVSVSVYEFFFCFSSLSLFPASRFVARHARAVLVL